MNTTNRLPDAQESGVCCDCEKRKAVTADGRFCLLCLRRRIADENPIPKGINDSRGRSSRSTKVTGGAAEMGTDGDEW
jgi:hypothetical protein